MRVRELIGLDEGGGSLFAISRLFHGFNEAAFTETETSLLLTDGSAHTQALHHIQWRHLLEKAVGRVIFVRHNQSGGQQHWGHAVLKSVKNAQTLIIQPDSGHKHDEPVNLEDTHLWWAKTVKNPMGGIPESELKQILEEGERLVLTEIEGKNPDIKPTDTVLMDLGTARFYGGQPVQKRYLFTESAVESYRFKRVGDANRLVKMLHRNPVTINILSETGLVVLAMSEAWAVVRAAKELKQKNGGELPKLRKLCEVPSPSLHAIEELYTAAFPDPVNGHGVATNRPPLSNEEKQTIRNSQNPTHGHGSTNGSNGRITGLFASPSPMSPFDPSQFNAVTVPLLIQQADEEAHAAMRDVLDAQGMVQEAIGRLQTAQSKRTALLLQIQPQIMAQALKEQAMDSLHATEKRLLKMLVQIGQGEIPTIDEVPA